MARDPAIAQTVRLFRGTAAAARMAVEAATPPVPDALRARVEEAIARAGAATSPVPADIPVTPTVSVTPVRTAANSPTYAIAASVAIVAVAVGAYFAGARQGDPSIGPGLAVVAPGAERAAFEEALAAAPAGSARTLHPGSSVSVTATFRDGSGHLCREFRLETKGADAVAGVACRAAGTWSVAFAAMQPGGDTFSPAAGSSLLDAFLAERGASPPLDAADEAAALRSADPPR
jgi:hypothetical protein